MSALITVGVNTLAFYAISEILPGFEIKNRKKLVLLAIAYSILVTLSMFIILPLSAVIAAVAWVVALIPIIGSSLAGAGTLISTFVISFGVTAILLTTIDKAMEDFNMKSPIVAIIASVMLAFMNVLMGWLIG